MPFKWEALRFGHCGFADVSRVHRLRDQVTGESARKRRSEVTAIGRSVICLVRMEKERFRNTSGAGSLLKEWMRSWGDALRENGAARLELRSVSGCWQKNSEIRESGIDGFRLVSRAAPRLSKRLGEMSVYQQAPHSLLAKWRLRMSVTRIASC